MRTLVAGTLLALAVAGCGESRKTVDLCNQLQAGELAKASDTVDSLYGSDSDDALLKHMEKGLVAHLQGDLNGAEREFDAAAPLVDDLRGSHVLDSIASSLFNDTVKTYVGRPFEHTQVDYYRTLDNLLAAEAADGRWAPPALLVPPAEGFSLAAPTDAAKAQEKAIITARRMTINQLKETEDAAGSTRYDDDPFARVLAAVAVFSEAPASRTETDQQLAAAMLTRALKAYARQQEVLGKDGNPFRYEVHGLPRIAQQLYLRQLKAYDPELYATESARLGIADALPPDGSGSLLVLNHVGLVARPQPLQIGLGALGFKSPDSTSFSWGALTFYAKGPGSEIANSWVALPIPGDVVQKCLAPGGATVIGFELPVHATDIAAGGPATVTAGGIARAGEVVCDLDAYARAELKDAQPALLVKTLIRVAAKQGLVALGSHVVDQHNSNGDGGLLAFAVNLAGSALATATESADLRAWNSLPNLIEATLIDLPAGSHPVAITTISGTHPLGTVRIDPGRLTLVSVRTMPPR